MPNIFPQALFDAWKDAAIDFVKSVNIESIGTSNILVAYEHHYKMNDNAANQVVTDSIGGIDGTWVAGNTSAASVAGKFTRALSFDGVSDYISVPNAVDFNIPTLSFALWVKNAASPLLWNRIISKKYAYSEDSGYEITLDGSNSSALYVSGSSGHFAVFDTGINWWQDTNWHHLAIVYDHDVVTLYVDGLLVGSASVASIVTNQYPLHFGKITSESTTMWNGLMDDVRVYPRALIADEVTLIYNASETEVPTLTVQDKVTSGKSRIQIRTPKTQTGKARNQVRLLKTQDGVSTLNWRTLQTQDGITRYQVTAQQTQIGGAYPNWNLLPYSEDIINQFAKAGVTAQSYGSPPSGVSTAIELDEINGSSGDHAILSNSPNNLPATTYTLSCYAKQGTRYKFALQMNDQVGGFPCVFFDLGLGTAYATGAGGTGVCTSVGGGWYRCSVTGSINPSANWIGCWIHVCDDSGNLSYTGASGKNIYFTGVQLVKGGTVTPYYKRP